MPGFYASGIRPTSSQWDDEKGGVIRAIAVLALALPTPSQVEVSRLGRLGFKIGLLIRGGQQVVSLAASGELSQEAEQVSRDLVTVFGAPAGYRWVGRVFKQPPVPVYPVPDVAEYKLEMVLAGASDLPQLIPAPSRYGNDESFSESHLTALWFVQRPPGSRH